MALRAALATPAAPFTECPAIGNDTSCGILLDVTDSGVTVLEDPSQGPYDGADDTLIGVLNQSSKTLGHIELGSDNYIFAFDGDGICSGFYVGTPAGCPFGPTGYEGPGTEFVPSSSYTNGVVNFTSGIASGGTAYFSLEEPLTSSTVVSGGPSVIEQGGAPNGSEHPTTCGAGDPVNCATGTFWHEFTDASVPGRSVPLKFTRTYSSLNATTDGPLGYGWTDSYNMSLSIDSETGAATVHEESGSAVTFPSTGVGQFTTPPRVLASLVKNEDGTYTFSRYSNHIEYVFSEAGQLIREVDRNGATTTLTYSGGLLEKVTDPSGRSLAFAYEGSHIHTITDPMGRATKFGYDAGGDLVSTTDALGRTWNFGYSPEHLLLSMTDPRGGTTTNTYDSSDRVTAQADPMGRATTWSYTGEPTGPAGGSTTTTDGRGDVTVYDYQNLELMSLTHGAGTSSEATTSYRYDPITLGVTNVTDPDGHVTANTYDAHGNLTSTTDPLGRTSYYYYNALDEVYYCYDPRGTATTYTYDEHGNLLEKSTPLQETGEVARTAYSYEAEPGELTAVTDPVGHITKFAYDSAGDRTSLTDAVGHTTTFSYDTDGELTVKTIPGGHATTYVYDAGGQLTGETDPLGHTTSYSYDADGNRVSVFDANGHTTQQSYDADNELVQVTRPDGSVLRTEWDAAGNLVAQIDASGHTTTHAYDPLGQPISVTDPDGHTTSYRYDPAGRKIAMTNAEGEATSYGYDAVGELTSVHYSDEATPSVSESYDADGNRVELTDGSGTSTFTYDSLGQMIAATDGSGATVRYTYDLAGHLTTLTYPNGQSVTRGYDETGNLTSVTDWQGHTTNFSYNADSNVSEQQSPGGVTTQLGYDSADRLASIKDTNGSSTLASFDDTRDAIGQVTSETAINGETATTNYSHNTLDQLTAAGEASYAYDAADNPTTFAAATQTFDPASELLTSRGPGEAPEHPSEEPSSGHENPPSLPHPPTPVGGTQPPVIPGPTPHNGVQSFRPSHTPPKLDGLVSTASASQSKLTTHRLRTRGAHDLIVAFISAASGQGAASISGDHLHWSWLAHASAPGGTTEIWQAHATTRLKGPITVRLRQSGHPATATIAAFEGHAYIAAHTSTHGQASTPTNSLIPPEGALLWAVGHSTGQKQSVAPHAGQRLVAQTYNKHARTDGWVQATTPSAGARIADTKISGHWTLLAIAIETQPAHAVRTSRLTSSPTAAGTPNSSPASGNTMPRLDHATPSASVLVTRQFTYNARGDRTEETTAASTTRKLSYDQADRLITVGSAIAYAYDGDGLRISRTVSGTITAYAWNRAEAMPELLQDGPTYYIYGPEGQPIEQITGETPTYLHQDQQGSVRLLTDASGSVVGRYNYDAWGNVTNHTGTATTNLQYDGQYTDAETGFQYLRARYYDPATGQFLTQDPAFVLTKARYGFGGNNPLTFGDPTGQWFGIDTLLGTAIGAIVGTAAGAGGYGLSVITGSQQFSWRGLGASTAGGLVGGAAAGACGGTTWVLVAACGAAGGVIGTATSQWLGGQQITAGGLLEGGALGALGGAAGKWLFPLRGFVPYKLINVIKPGINAWRLYGQGAVGGLVDIFGHATIQLVVCSDT